MKRRIPSYLSHIKRGSGAHGTYCANKCLQEYMICLESIVVIAGVAFVTLSAGTGLIILAPVAS